MKNLKVQELDPEVNADLCKSFSDGFKKFVRVGEKGWLYPQEILQNYETYKNFQCRSDDIWISSYPRSGTTVTHDIVWMIVNNLDFEKYDRLKPPQRVPFFDRNSVQCKEKGSENLRKIGKTEKEIEELYEEIEGNIPNLEKHTGQRVIKSHLPYELGPDNLFSSGCKLIYVARNVKDQIVSYYHLQQLVAMRPYVGSFEKYWEYVEKNMLLHSPYWEHIKQAWELRNNKNFLFLFYEDLRKDLRAYIKKIAEFIEKPLSESDLDKMVQFFEFNNFKNKRNILFSSSVGKQDQVKKGNEFVRKGAVNGWKEFFTGEINRKADKWIEENIRKIPGFKYPDTVQL